MLVFLTWSGDRSKAVASALRDCLRLICNSFQPWMSERDIAKGAPWFPEILDTLGKCGAGIVCITPENQDERWLLFESGAVVKSVPERRLAIPYLYGMKPGELRPPLKEIQAAKNAQDEGENWHVIQSLYGALPPAERTINETELRAAFEMVWTGKLKPLLDKIPAAAAPPPAGDAPDPNAEMLALLRELVERDRERRAREDRGRMEDYARGYWTGAEREQASRATASKVLATDEELSAEVARVMKAGGRVDPKLLDIVTRIDNSAALREAEKLANLRLDPNLIAKLDAATETFRAAERAGVFDAATRASKLMEKLSPQLDAAAETFRAAERAGVFDAASLGRLSKGKKR